jgi:hypothetical protein
MITRLPSILISASLFASVAQAQELAQLVASDPAARDAFGQAVAMSGNTVLVSARYANVPEGDRGAAYVFVGSGATWSQQAKLIAADGRALDNFSSSLAISGDTAAVGAHGDDLVDFSNANEGSAYAFVRTGSAWSQQAKLTASDAALGDLFGLAITVNADTIAVSAPYDDDLGTNSGSVYVFTRSGTTWSQQAKLTAGDGIAGDLFGTSLSLDGDTLVIGSEHHDDGASNSGSAYVFVRSGTAWSQQAKLNASDGAANESHGRSVSLLGDSLVVGTYQKDQSGIDSGCAYVYTRSGTVWTERIKLVASDAGSFDYFGRSVAITPGTIVVGACQKNVVGKCSGAAYVFLGSGSTWTQSAKLTPTEAAPLDFFGMSVSASGTVAVVGAGFDDDSALNAGSAHIFPLESEGDQFCIPNADAIACPCSNQPSGTRGCNNFGAHSGGAALSGSGSASLAADSLILTAVGENNTSLTVYFQGRTDITPGVPHGAGVRCVTGTLRRIYSGSASGGAISRPLGADPSVHTRSATVGDPITAGESRFYFTIYRDPAAASPCGNTASTINLSNAVGIQWAP